MRESRKCLSQQSPCLPSVRARVRASALLSKGRGAHAAWAVTWGCRRGRISGIADPPAHTASPESCLKIRGRWLLQNGVKVDFWPPQTWSHYIHAHTHACTQALSHAHTHALTHSPTHALSHTRMHSLSHARTHAPTHARIQPLPYTQRTEL